MEMNIAVCVNSKYVRYLYVMLVSLLENNKDEKMTLHVLQRDLTESDKELINTLWNKYDVGKVQYHWINEKDFKLFPETEKLPVETCFRVRLADILPEQLDRVLCLDVDLIVQGKLRELYEIEMKDEYFAAGIDLINQVLPQERRTAFERKHDFRYYNTGVLVFNLSVLRKQVKFDHYLEAVQRAKFKLLWPEQDLINYMFYDKIKLIDANKWNYLALADDEGYHSEISPSIIHFCDVNPWRVGIKNKKYSIWWEYAKKTPYYYDFIEEQLLSCEQGMREIIPRKIAAEVRADAYLTIIKLIGMGEKGKEIILELLEGKKLLLYGTGQVAEMFYTLLRIHKCEHFLKSCIDMYKQGSFHNVPIYKSVNECIEEKNDYVLVITPSDGLYRIKRSIEKEAPENVKVLSVKMIYEG